MHSSLAVMRNIFKTFSVALITVSVLALFLFSKCLDLDRQLPDPFFHSFSLVVLEY